MDISKWIERKNELRLTYDEIAERSGVARRTVAGIFGGDPRYESPTWVTIQRINNALGIEDSLADTVKETITPREYRLLSAFRDLDDTTQKLFLALMEKVERRR